MAFANTSCSSLEDIGLLSRLLPMIACLRGMRKMDCEQGDEELRQMDCEQRREEHREVRSCIKCRTHMFQSIRVSDV